MRARWLTWPIGCVLVLGLAGCGGPDEPRAPLGVDDAPGWLPPGVAAKVVDFHGSCNWGREVGAPERYRVPLRAAGNPSGTILVRVDARFDPLENGNVIGELPAGTRVLGDGPLHGGHGVGYAILVRGHTGRVCRGYVSATAVVVERDGRAGDRARPRDGAREAGRGGAGKR